MSRTTQSSEDMIEAVLGAELLKRKVADWKTIAQKAGAINAEVESLGKEEQSMDVQSVSEAESQSARLLSRMQDAENMDGQPVSDAGFHSSRSSVFKGKHVGVRIGSSRRQESDLQVAPALRPRTPSINDALETLRGGYARRRHERLSLVHRVSVRHKR
jgi:hypothetical protein